MILRRSTSTTTLHGGYRVDPDTKKGTSFELNGETHPFHIDGKVEKPIVDAVQEQPVFESLKELESVVKSPEVQKARKRLNSPLYRLWTRVLRGEGLGPGEVDAMAFHFGGGKQGKDKGGWFMTRATDGNKNGNPVMLHSAGRQTIRLSDHDITVVTAPGNKAKSDEVSHTMHGVVNQDTGVITCFREEIRQRVPPMSVPSAKGCRT